MLNLRISPVATHNILKFAAMRNEALLAKIILELVSCLWALVQSNMNLTMRKKIVLVEQ